MMSQKSVRNEPCPLARLRSKRFRENLPTQKMAKKAKRKEMTKEDMKIEYSEWRDLRSEVEGGSPEERERLLGRIDESAAKARLEDIVAGFLPNQPSEPTSTVKTSISSTTSLTKDLTTKNSTRNDEIELNEFGLEDDIFGEPILGSNDVTALQIPASPPVVQTVKSTKHPKKTTPKTKGSRSKKSSSSTKKKKHAAKQKSAAKVVYLRRSSRQPVPISPFIMEAFKSSTYGEYPKNIDTTPSRTIRGRTAPSIKISQASVAENQLEDSLSTTPPAVKKANTEPSNVSQNPVKTKSQNDESEKAGLIATSAIPTLLPTQSIKSPVASEANSANEKRYTTPEKTTPGPSHKLLALKKRRAENLQRSSVGIEKKGSEPTPSKSSLERVAALIRTAPESIKQVLPESSDSSPEKADLTESLLTGAPESSDAQLVPVVENRGSPSSPSLEGADPPLSPTTFKNSWDETVGIFFKSPSSSPTYNDPVSFETQTSSPTLPDELNSDRNGNCPADISNILERNVHESTSVSPPTFSASTLSQSSPIQNDGILVTESVNLNVLPATFNNKPLNFQAQAQSNLMMLAAPTRQQQDFQYQHSVTAPRIVDHIGNQQNNQQQSQEKERIQSMQQQSCCQDSVQRQAEIVHLAQNQERQQIHQQSSDNIRVQMENQGIQNAQPNEQQQEMHQQKPQHAPQQPQISQGLQNLGKIQILSTNVQPEFQQTQSIQHNQPQQRMFQQDAQAVQRQPVITRIAQNQEYELIYQQPSENVQPQDIQRIQNVQYNQPQQRMFQRNVQPSQQQEGISRFVQHESNSHVQQQPPTNRQPEIGRQHVLCSHHIQRQQQVSQQGDQYAHQSAGSAHILQIRQNSPIQLLFENVEMDSQHGQNVQQLQQQQMNQQEAQLAQQQIDHVAMEQAQTPRQLESQHKLSAQENQQTSYSVVVLNVHDQGIDVAVNQTETGNCVLIIGIQMDEFGRKELIQRIKQLLPDELQAHVGLVLLVDNDRVRQQKGECQLPSNSVEATNARIDSTVRNEEFWKKLREKTFHRALQEFVLINNISLLGNQRLQRVEVKHPVFQLPQEPEHSELSQQQRQLLPVAEAIIELYVQNLCNSEENKLYYRSFNGAQKMACLESYGIYLAKKYRILLTPNDDIPECLMQTISKFNLGDQVAIIAIGEQLAMKLMHKGLGDAVQVFERRILAQLQLGPVVVEDHQNSENHVQNVSPAQAQQPTPVNRQNSETEEPLQQQQPQELSNHELRLKNADYIMEEYARNFCDSEEKKEYYMNFNEAQKLACLEFFSVDLKHRKARRMDFSLDFIMPESLELTLSKFNEKERNEITEIGKMIAQWHMEPIIAVPPTIASHQNAENHVQNVYLPHTQQPVQLSAYQQYPTPEAVEEIERYAEEHRQALDRQEQEERAKRRAQTEIAAQRTNEWLSQNAEQAQEMQRPATEEEWQNDLDRQQQEEEAQRQPEAETAAQRANEMQTLKSQQAQDTQRHATEGERQQAFDRQQQEEESQRQADAESAAKIANELQTKALMMQEHKERQRIHKEERRQQTLNRQREEEEAQRRAQDEIAAQHVNEMRRLALIEQQALQRRAAVDEHQQASNLQQQEEEAQRRAQAEIAAHRENEMQRLVLNEQQEMQRRAAEEEQQQALNRQQQEEEAQRRAQAELAAQRANQLQWLAVNEQQLNYMNYMSVQFDYWQYLAKLYVGTNGQLPPWFLQFQQLINVNNFGVVPMNLQNPVQVEQNPNYDLNQMMFQLIHGLQNLPLQQYLQGPVFQYPLQQLNQPHQN